MIVCLNRRKLPLPPTNEQMNQASMNPPTQDARGNDFEKIISTPSGAELRGSHI